MAEHSHDHDHSHDHNHNHDHSHSHGPGQSLLGHGHIHADAAPRAIAGAIAVTVVFMLVELVGGWVANSLALISDGGHMLTDVGAMLLSLFAIWVSRRPSTATMSFGYHRAEILGALTSGLLIWLLAGVLIFEAVTRLQNPPEVQGPMVFIIATIGLIANLVSMKMLHGSKDHSMNVRAAYLHLLSDMLGSVGAIIAGAVLWLTGWRLIDPIVTILFSLLMLVSSWALVKEAVSILMESTPSSMDPGKIRADLLALEGVSEVHDLHIWTVASGRHALSVHIISTETQTLLSRANDLLREQHGIQHTTVQIEHPEAFRSENCYDCAPAKPNH